MKTGSGIKNIIKYRLTGTPDGNLLVSFYHLNVFDQQAVNWRIAEQLVDEKMGPEVLYEGNLNNNTHYQPAILNLLRRVEVYVNCVRIERTN
ncbi:MAG: hypothetical protein EOO61_16700 [Hymenobacter sp.]|nr:MAG: hypothetical protein EOO61_16700 [Hymenobacter sp.]